MANAFLYENKLESVQAVLTADQEDASYPAENLVTGVYAQPWRTTDVLSSHNVVQDFGAAVEVDTVWLGNVNLTSGATVKIQANASDSWGAPSVDETLTVSGLGQDPAHVNLWHELSSAQTYRYWRLLITDGSNPDGWLEVGEWWLGSRVSLAGGEDFQTVHSEIYPDRNLLHETEWAQEYVYSRDLDDIRTFSLRFRPKGVSNLNVLRKLKRYTNGSGRAFVFAPNRTATPVESFFVRMTGDFTVTQDDLTVYSVDMNLREQARGVALPADV